VKTPPYVDGEEITAGLIYRRIPNRPGFFDHDNNCPRFLAFWPSERDRRAGGISALLKDYVSEEEARTNPHDREDRTFGLCLLDIAAIRVIRAAGVRYNPRGTGTIGRAHVQIYGCEDVEVQQQLVLLAKVVRAPG
jgi:hypothetical protein